MTQRDGFGLLEVIIALGILAVGVLGAFAMQASALRGTSTAQVAQEMANVAESEVQLQREFRRTVTSSVTGETCRTDYDGERYECSVSVVPCALSDGDVLCSASQTNDVVARQVVVTVNGPGGRTARVSTVAK